jgi:hypothetical protein
MDQAGAYMLSHKYSNKKKKAKHKISSLPNKRCYGPGSAIRLPAVPSGLNGSKLTLPAR